MVSDLISDKNLAIKTNSPGVAVPEVAVMILVKEKIELGSGSRFRAQ